MIKHSGIMAGTTIKGMYDYVGADGALHLNNESRDVMVTSESDLAQLDGYLPGAVAYTAGFGSMWQLDASGSWVSMSEDSALPK